MLCVDSPFPKKMKIILAAFIITKTAEDNSLFWKRVFTIFQTTNIYYVNFS